MKLLSLQEASPIARYPVSQEIYARIQRDKRGNGRSVSQEDVGKFAAWHEVQTNGIGKSDLPRIVWEGLEGMKDNPQEVEKVFVDYVRIYEDDFDEYAEIESREEAREEAIEELVDDFFSYISGKRR